MRRTPRVYHDGPEGYGMSRHGFQQFRKKQSDSNFPLSKDRGLAVFMNNCLSVSLLVSKTTTIH